jgi:lipoate-protein ligase A
MTLLDLTLPSPAENLACDEALLHARDAGAGPDVLRFWEARESFVVLGHGNRAGVEANLDACRARGVPVLRRCSGGGAVLQGPGCLNYALVLGVDDASPLASVTGANRFLMQRHADVLAALLGAEVRAQGHTDLTLGARKFSGNSQRRLRHALLFHGTFLLACDLARIEQFLRFPSRQPAYRQHRAHGEFLTNLKVPATAVKAALQAAWQAQDRMVEWPREEVARLAREKYTRDEWNLKFP